MIKNYEKPEVGTIVIPFHSRAIACKVADRGGFLTKISRNIYHVWKAETNLDSLKSGLTCFIKERPEAYHDIRIIKVGEKSVTGELVVNESRINYVTILTEAVDNPSKKESAIAILQKCDRFNLADQLARDVPGEIFEDMADMVCEALSRYGVERMIEDLQHSEYDYNYQIMNVLRNRLGTFRGF